MEMVSIGYLTLLMEKKNITSKGVKYLVKLVSNLSIKFLRQKVKLGKI